MPLRRSFAIAEIGLRWFCYLCGLAVVSGVAGYGIVWAVTGDQSVFDAVNVVPVVTAARAGGVIEYHYTQRRYETCPGTVVEVFTSQDGPRRIIREQRRPVEYPTAGERALVIKVPVPGDLAPGRYRFRDYIVSQCPLREHTDDIADFAVEVQP